MAFRRPPENGMTLEMNRNATLSLLIFFLSLLAFCANTRSISSGDTYPATYLPFSILNEGNLDLDEFEFLHNAWSRRAYPTLEGIPYYLRYSDGHYYSAYTVGPAILALPVYLIPVLAGLEPDSEITPMLAKYAASLMVAFSILFLFWALRLLIPWKYAFGFALISALCTNSLSISSQALWQHGPSQFFLALMLYALVRSQKDSKWISLAGFALGCAFVMRTTNIMLAPPLLYYLFSRHRQRMLVAVAAFLPPVLLMFLYYWLAFGAFSPVFSHLKLGTLAGFKQVPIYEGLAGILFLPARGLFVFSPILIFSVVGAVIGIRNKCALTTAVAISCSLIVLITGKWFMWWGGHCYGPRLLADLSPLLCFCLYPLVPVLEKRSLLRICFIALAVISFGIHLLGAFKYDGRWDVGAKTDLVYEATLNPYDSPIMFYANELFSDNDNTSKSGKNLSKHEKLPAQRLSLDDLITAKHILAGSQRPILTVETDVAGYNYDDFLKLRLISRYSHRPHAANIYLVVRKPNGKLLFFDGAKFHDYNPDNWIPWCGIGPVAYSTDTTFNFNLNGWNPGEYTWYFSMTDIHRTIPLATASTTFSISPSPVQATSKNKGTEAGGCKDCNFILISMDTVRADHLPCYGYSKNTTPYLCQFAQKADLYENAYSPAPVTLPALSSILTGTLPGQKNVDQIMSRFDSQTSLPSELKKLQYKTAGFTDHDGIGNASRGATLPVRDFDEFKNIGGGMEVTLSRELTNMAIDWIRNNKDQKFFLWVHYFAPHFNYMPPKDLESKFGYNADNCGRIRSNMSIPEIRRIEKKLTPTELDCLVALHDAELYDTDRWIGQLLRQISILGLDEKTIVIITSDHGEEFKERTRIGHEWTVYNELIHVPLLVRHRRQTQGQRLPDVFNTKDLYHLVLGLATNTDRSFDAYSISRTFHYYRTDQFSPTRPNDFAIVEGSNKLIFNTQTNAVEFFDLAADPTEQHSDPKSPDARRLQKRLVDWIDANSQAVPPPRPELMQDYATTNEVLKQLGYVRD
jgi:arylsulfatase A-like enzyme